MEWLINKKLGILLGVFFTLISCSNIFIGTPIDTIIMLGVISILYFITIGKWKWQQGLQIVVTHVTGCLMLLLNDPSNPLPILVFVVGYFMNISYFNKVNKIGAFIVSLIPYIILMVTQSWELMQGVNIILFLGLYTVILYIFYSDKIQHK
jgi:hypothetical protein